jgi:hypothetical protein
MNKKVILLLANFRTGSSDYSYKLATDNDIHWLPEPHLESSQLELLGKLITTEKPFVVKLMPEHIDLNKHYQAIITSDCYKIKLTRESKIDQIVSHYIGLMTLVWNSGNEFARGKTYIVDIVRDKIKQSIDTIIKNDNMFDNLNIKFDDEITYEELLSKGLLGTRHVRIIPPTNINLIKTVIKKEYDKQR